MISMELETEIWRRAKKAKAFFHVVHDSSIFEIDGLLRASMPLAADNRELMRDLWNLRLTILQTFLPLNSPQLALAATFGRVASARELRSLRSGYETVLSTIIVAAGNPKKNIIDDLFCASDQGIDVWNRPWSQQSPGWPSEVKDFLGREYGPGLRVIAGIRELPDAGPQLVLVSPLQARRFPQANAVRLLRPGRWASVHVIRYGMPIEDDSFTREALLPPFAPWFWRGGWEIQGGGWEVQDSTTGIPQEPRTTQIDAGSGAVDAIDDLGLESIFGPSDGSAGEPVGACVVQLSSGFCVALANVDKVRLLNRKQEWISVLDLEDGDLIPVRIDDSDRQLLEETATARMGGAHAEAVKSRLSGWKQVVRTCLGRHGEVRFKSEFDRFAGKSGEAWRDDAWTGERPWAPRSRKDFRALLLAANALGFFLGEQDIDKFILSSWRDVQFLRNAHRLAGRDLVHQLDDELDQMVREHHEWRLGDEVGPETGGRKYRVYEVVSVRDAGMLCPGQLQRLKKWPE